MSDNNYLKFFIEEEVYVLPGDTIFESSTTTETEPKPVKQPEEKIEEPIAPVEEPKKVVQAEQKPEPSPEPELPQYTPPVYSGHFVKGVLVVVHSKHLKFDHMDLLEKILSSIGITKEDAAILPSGHMQSKEDFEWVNNLEKKQTFMFGLPDKWMQQFHHDITKYVNHETTKGKLMFIDSLVDLNNEVTLKKQLWGQLKAING